MPRTLILTSHTIDQARIPIHLLAVYILSGSKNFAIYSISRNCYWYAYGNHGYISLFVQNQQISFLTSGIISITFEHAKFEGNFGGHFLVAIFCKSQEGTSRFKYIDFSK